MSKRNWKVDPYLAEQMIYNDISSDELISKLYPEEISRADTKLKQEKKEINSFIQSIALRS